ncbi:MAG: 3-methyl-2-oxobutanoate hydroxymethyltransferase [Actinomycetota bacterium]|jgi:3-methyl-2-oxobutanoate hydroxymethyltransferase|nr:3-methyl-2-oxobutanoate hydroxymethyltransferase [Actinomycetota bacterium]
MTAAAAARASLYGGPVRPGDPAKRIRVQDLWAAKRRGEKWAMLTAYDYSTAALLDAAGIPVLLVGDSAANVVYGYDTTVPVTVDELLPLVRGVVRGARRALVVADLPFGSYQSSPAQALDTAARFLKEAGAHAVKLEGGRRVVPQVEALVAAGVPVMGHLGLTPQSVHAMGGYSVQGRGEQGELLLDDAKALEAAGAFAIVLEVIPVALAEQVTAVTSVPTIGIGAGPACDAQVMVWQDMAAFRVPGGGAPKFVKAYAELGDRLQEAAHHFAEEVRSGVYPGPQHAYH